MIHSTSVHIMIHIMLSPKKSNGGNKLRSTDESWRIYRQMLIIIDHSRPIIKYIPGLLTSSKSDLLYLDASPGYRLDIYIIIWII